MDVQLKKGILDYCVLAVLGKGDSYGYQIVKDVSACIEISESTLYPILKRLEAAACLTTYSVEHSGRLRKYYCIMEPGRARLQDFLDTWPQLEAIHDLIEEGANANG